MIKLLSLNCAVVITISPLLSFFSGGFVVISDRKVGSLQHLLYENFFTGSEPQQLGLILENNLNV